MPSTYTSNNKIQKIATGEQSGTWGSTTNTNFDLFDTAIDGSVTVALSGTTQTLNIPDGAAGDGRNKVLIFTGSLAGTNTVTVTPSTVKKHYFVQNNTTGGQNVVISQGSGSSVTVKPGYSSIVYLDGAGSGAAVKEVLTSLKLTALLEATGAVFVGSSSGTTTLQSAAAASGTLTLPAATDTLVGKATTDTLTNKTFDTAGTGNVFKINGTQITANTGTGSNVLATSPTLVTPLLGTPTSGTLTNCTGLPVSTGISGLGTGVATFLATPSSANLASAVTDETGSGALVFGTSPTIATPTITTSATVPLVIGGTGTTSTLTLRSTSGVGATGADIVFQAGNNGATEVMRLQNGGNVGIGTASPATKLHVGAVAVADGNVTLSAGTSMIYTTATSGAALTWNAYTNGGYANTIMAQLKPRQDTSANYNLDVFCGTWNNNNSAGTAVATFQSTGNVGIGTTAPSTGVALDIVRSAADVQIRAYTGTVDLRVLSYNAGAGVIGTNSAHPLILATNGLAERMRILSTGEVGIGTTSPKQLLHVAGQGLFTTSAASYDPGDGAGSAVRIGYNTGGDYGYLICSNTGVASKRLLVGGSTIEFLVSGVEKGRFDSGGNFGIGMTSPGTKLDVLASGTVNTTADPFGSAASFVGPSALGGQNANSIVSISSNDAIAANTGGVLAFGGRYSGTAQANWASIVGFKENATSGEFGGFMAFYTRAHGGNNLERMRISPSGNVGIGTASPATSAAVDISSTTGALLVPRMTTTQRDALTATNGMILYNTTDNQMQARVNGAWVAL